MIAQSSPVHTRVENRAKTSVRSGIKNVGRLLEPYECRNEAHTPKHSALCPLLGANVYRGRFAISGTHEEKVRICILKRVRDERKINS